MIDQDTRISPSNAIQTRLISGPHRHSSTLQPSFAGGALPAPEAAWQTATIRIVAVLTLLLSLIYLGWRAWFTVDLDFWWVSIPLLLLEIHAFVGLMLFTFSLWHVDTRPARRVVDSTTARIAVLIPTYNEEREILLPTIAAAIAVRLPHETWVLDDGNRPWVRQLAAELGAHYIARTERSHAKAGNINHALAVIEADFVAVLDADHVAAPDLLVNTLGYFDDPRVAIVQTPQDFYNLDSFEYDERSVAGVEISERAAYHEQALFYRLLQAGKNRWDAAFWCGTNAVVRVAALRDVGGIATETITEDIHTTIKLHRHGWKTVYHNEVLARGLAASDAAQYMLQRFRWGTGAMQVLRLDNPLTSGALRLGQRLAYASTLLGWFDAWRTLGYLLLPIVVLATGAIPIRAEPTTFVLAFGLTLVLQQFAMRLLSRGFYRPILSTVFELVRMTPTLLATLTLVRPKALRFQVTPKGRMGDARRRMPVPRLLHWVVVASLSVAIWFVLTVAGFTPLHYGEPWAAYVTAFWLSLNMALVLVAMNRVRSLKYGAERRRSVRFATSLTGALDGRSCQIRDVSLTGALVCLPESIALGKTASQHRQVHRLTIMLDQQRVNVQVVVRSQRLVSSGYVEHGLEFCEDQNAECAQLTLALFNRQIVPEIRLIPQLEYA